jgi:hypothetical protein
LNILGKLCFAMLFLSAAACAQTFNMSMETNLAAWNSCALPGCDPGGTGVPTQIVMAETGTTWPPNSMQLSVTGPAWTNLLAYDKVGASTAAYFQSDFWVYIPTANAAANYQALEYDIFQFLAPYEFMWGSECVIEGQWQIWDQLHQQWLNTARACSMPAGRWHHIQWWVHRVDGDTGCDGYPCMYFDMLGVDGVYTRFEETEPSGPMPVGWSNNSGLNFQLDISGAEKKATATEYLQNVNLVELGN